MSNLKDQDQYFVYRLSASNEWSLYPTPLKAHEAESRFRHYWNHMSLTDFLTAQVATGFTKFNIVAEGFKK